MNLPMAPTPSIAPGESLASTLPMAPAQVGAQALSADEIAELQSEVRALARERRAVILAHNYQVPEVQDVADYVGDSLGLSRQAAISQGHALLAEFAFPTAERTQCRHLSGGARQKVNLALALLGGANILLLDEPYQGFDHGSYVSFWEHVERWRADGLGVVVVTHLLADTALVHGVVDRVVEMTIPREAAAEER